MPNQGISNESVNEMVIRIHHLASYCGERHAAMGSLKLGIIQQTTVPMGPSIMACKGPYVITYNRGKGIAYSLRVGRG